ncbi:MAG: hypothetical protein ACRCVJ_18605 [Clostridium sp.]|uniref:hypothetical protein n=1 Tax=Clostridium sp. TaxID=1506 RepID=UPI003F30B0ED
MVIRINTDIGYIRPKYCNHCMGTGNVKAMQSACAYGKDSVKWYDTTIKCKFCNGKGIIN